MLRVRAKQGTLDEQTRKAIADNKDELIRLIEAGETAVEENVVPAANTGVAELSRFQERLWIVHRLEPTSTAYNMVVVWPGVQGIDADQTIEAIGRLTSRHDLLRAMFRDEGGTPRVQLGGRPEIETRDLTALGEPEVAARIEAERSAAAHRAFDLENAPAIRWIVCRLPGGRTVVLVCAHHIVTDQWSFGLLRQEWIAECENLARGGDPLPRPTFQYGDYAAWQRRMSDSPEARADLDWWVQRLAGLPQFSTFAADHSGNVPAGASRSFAWDADLTRAIHDLARAQGVTVYMTLLAACAAVLRAHVGQNDLVLGSPMGVRERVEFERVIGPFVNLLLLRFDLDDDPSFADLLKRSRDAVLDAHDHRQVSFEALVERLNPVRSFDRSPLFQISVVLHDSAGGETGDIWSGGAIQDLTWYVSEVDGRLQGSLEYRTDLYEADTIDRIALHLQAMLRAALRDPQRRLSELSLLSAGERETVLEGFNATDRDIDPAPFVAQFERQAAATPDAIAVSSAGERWTYDALNRHANRLARVLRGKGIGDGVLVGVGMRRSLHMVSALIAIQKAGAAYLPLDPNFPSERLAFMLTDGGARVLLTDGAAALAAPAGVEAIDVPSLDLGGVDDGNPGGTVGPRSVAYVLYTSGSTGQPNGVVIDHAALANFLAGMLSVPGLARDDVLAAVTTISFDIAGLELYLPLITGARIELVSAETASDGFALSRLLAESGATVLQATPATWRLLIEAGWRGSKGFRGFCGGEALPRDLAADLLKRMDELWNLYGPTETTIWSTVEQVQRNTAQITVGRPIANTQVYVVDGAGEPCPIGMRGEIWIGGAGVARGYHQREALTAKRFVPDRFALEPGSRAYRTGDLGHWRPDGRLVHDGRIDHQVKVRGFRIELGEIETALRAHPAVKQVAVIARDGGDSDVRLVAYVVYADGEDALTGSEARAHLRRSLPDYMLPSIYVELDRLPLTPNGKLDRRALPDPYRRAVAQTAYTAPATSMERLVARVWQDLLHVERVSVDDNFFELGGHSLLSLRVAAAIRRETGAQIQPRALFFQTLREIAASIRRDDVPNPAD